MGETKETTTGATTQQTSVQATPEETELNKLLLERQRAAQPGVLEAQAGGLSLINQLLTGQGLPGFLGQLPGGISSEAIGTQAAQLARQSLAGFQGQGLADSGVAFRETARGIGSELLFPAEQFNLQNLSQLLNLAVGGSAQVQAPITAGAGQLGQQLAGLRSISQAGTQIGKGSTQYDFFTSPFTTALAGAATAPLGTEAFGEFLFK